MAAPNFSLYGPTPSAASAQQMPWAGYYTDQNNLNERARAAAVIQSIQLQEQQDRADQQARQFDQARNIDFSRYAHRLSEGRRAEAEDLRRFNVDRDWRRDQAAEEKRRFGISSEISRAKVPEYEQPETAAEKLAAQLDILNSESARAIARKIANFESAQQQSNRLYRITPEDAQKAAALSPLERSLIVRSLAEKMGTPDPTIRWDDDTGVWTTAPAVSRGFSPVMGRVRQAENESPRVNFGSLSTTPVTTTATPATPPPSRRFRWTPEGLVPQ